MVKERWVVAEEQVRLWTVRHCVNYNQWKCSFVWLLSFSEAS